MRQVVRYVNCKIEEHLATKKTRQCLKMSVKCMGIQASVSQLNELSRFVPCAIHNLNLEDTHTAKILVVMAFV